MHSQKFCNNHSNHFSKTSHDTIEKSEYDEKHMYFIACLLFITHKSQKCNEYKTIAINGLNIYIIK